GGIQPRWIGRCPDCGAWDALEAQRVEKSARRDPQQGAARAFALLADHPDDSSVATDTVARPITRIDAGDDRLGRLPTGLAELDRVLGGAAPSGSRGSNGGFVPGSAILIGGAPGIGKSTLLLQAAQSMASRGVRVLYVSSEES